MVVFIDLLSVQVASLLIFAPLGVAVLALTFLGMAVTASMPFQMILTFTIVRPFGMVALALIFLRFVRRPLASDLRVSKHWRTRFFCGLEMSHAEACEDNSSTSTAHQV
jgi:hypothetical protein